MQCFTHYAVFLSVVGHFSEFFRHRDKPNVSVTPSVADFYNWIIGNGEAPNQWNEILDLYEHIADTFFLLFFSLKKKKKVFEIPVSAVPGHVESPTGSAVDIGRQKKTSRGHQQLPLAWINVTSVLQSVQALAECNSTE